MKILLTGANGFVGSYLFNYLSNNHDVYTLSRTKGYYNFDLEYDVPNFEITFDLVIHAAGKAHNFPKNSYESNQLYTNNISITKNLLRGIDKSNTPKYFVFISSVSVYGLFEGHFIDENFPLNAKDDYGLSKIESEKLIINWCKKNDVKYTILRLPLVAGQNAPGNLGNMIKAIKHRYYFNISNTNVKKSIVQALDVAKFLITAAKTGGIYNLTDGEHPTIKKLSLHIANQLGINFVPSLNSKLLNYIAIIGDKIGPKFPLNTNKLIKLSSSLTFDDTNARKSFGWNPDPVLLDFKI